MLHYRGPAVKKCKRLNTYFLPGFSRKYCPFLQFKNGLSGVISSSYLNDLVEKQRFKYTFLLTEKSIKKYLFYKRHIVKHNFLENVVTRIDVILFRLGFFKTIKQARQNVLHGHILVNYRVVTCPSFAVGRGYIISINPKCYFVVRMCRKNLIEQNLNYKYYKLVLFCWRTMTVLILGLEELEWPILFNLRSLYKYYFV